MNTHDQEAELLYMALSGRAGEKLSGYDRRRLIANALQRSYEAGSVWGKAVALADITTRLFNDRKETTNVGNQR